jgi:hypothetical protein
LLVFLADLIALKEKHASRCEELDVLRVELAKLQSWSTLQVLAHLALCCMENLLNLILALFHFRLN